MTARGISETVERLARQLRAQDLLRAATRALLLGSAAAAVVTLARIVWWPAIPLAAAPLVLGIVAVLRFGMLRRDTRVTATDAALWLERQVPSLQYALVTLVETGPALAASPAVDRLTSAVTASSALQDGSALVQARLRPRLGALGAACLAAVVACAPWPARSLDGGPPTGMGARTGGAGVRAVAGRVSATASITAPAYAGGATRALGFGATVQALQGSLLTVDGERGAERVQVEVRERRDSTSGGRPVLLDTSAGGWRAHVRVGTDPLAMRLRDPAGDRWVFVVPVTDSAPVVTLDAPAEDLLLTDTTATLALAGRAHDDVGLRDVRVEWIVSSGGGERFTFRSGVLAQRAGALGREQAVVARLPLRMLALTPGDMVHVRITARDGNTISGPSLGASDTRTLRVPRADERDSVAVEQLPPTPVEKNVLSQRQLILLTERLVQRLPRLERTVVVRESQTIGDQQARLRKQVGEIIFARLGDTPSGEHAHFAGDGHNHSASELAALKTPEDVLRAAERATASSATTVLDNEGDETPVVAVNRPLLEAYNAMWDATRALQGGTPREALDPMRRALAAIQRARLAERVYLRGSPPAAIVDLAKIRLTGTDTAAAASRRPLAALPAPQRALVERLQRAISALGQAPAAALDSLRLVRLDALADAPGVAAPLSDAISALEAGRPAAEALGRARRALRLVVRADPGAALWGAGTP